MKIRPIIDFAFQNFTETAPKCSTSRYALLKNFTLDLLESVFLFFNYPQLADDLEDYDCTCPIPFEELRQKTARMTSVAPNQQWMCEINKYKLYVDQYSNIVESPGENNKEMLDDIVSTWKETLRTTHNKRNYSSNGNTTIPMI